MRMRAHADGACLVPGGDLGVREHPEWEFDLPEIQAAARVLGLRWPIAVAYLPDDEDYPEEGSYAMVERDGTLHHSILVSVTSVDPDRTLWHELAHAMQVERDGPRGGEYIPIPDTGSDAGAYLQQAYEREAREIEARHEGEVLTKRRAS